VETTDPSLAAETADPSPVVEIEMDSRCGGRSYVEGFLEVMEV
jgi:hypothetical protein